MLFFNTKFDIYPTPQSSGFKPGTVAIQSLSLKPGTISQSSSFKPDTVSRSPGFKPGTVSRSLGFKPGTVSQSPGFKSGTVSQSPGLKPGTDAIHLPHFQTQAFPSFQNFQNIKPNQLSYQTKNYVTLILHP